MFVCRRKWLVGYALYALLCPLPARGSEAADAVARLLDVGWSLAPQARAAADEQYEEAARLAGDHSQLLLASWLVLMQQRRFDEALNRIDEYLAKAPDDLDALRAKTWIQTLMKNYPAAVLTANRLSRALADDRPTTEEERGEHADGIGFLGRLLGYLGGPMAESFDQEERKALERKFLGRLDESQKTLFEDARNGVLSRYIEMTDESAEARDRAVVSAQAERQKTLTELKAARDEIATRGKELEDRKSKLQNELQAELTEIAKQDRPLVQEQARLNAQAAQLTNDLLNYQLQLGSLQQLAAQQTNNRGGRGMSQQYLAQMNTLALLIGRIDADLVGVSQLLRGVQTQRAALATRRNQAESNHASQVDRLQRELADLAKRERRSSGLEKRASRPVSVSTSRIRSISAQAAALSSYDNFPLEAAKAKLLESLR